MDIIQEHIKLLQAQLVILRRMYEPPRRYRAGRNCTKGYNCGGSCITRKKNCRKALEGEAKNFSDWMVQKMSAGIGGVLGDKPVEKSTPSGSNELDPAINKEEYKRLTDDGTYGKQAEIWANTELSYDEKVAKDSELQSISQQEYDRLISEGVDEESALILKDEWMMSDREKEQAREIVGEVQSQTQKLKKEILDAETRQTQSKESERKRASDVKAGNVDKSELTADQVVGFKRGSDVVVRKSDGTYIQSQGGDFQKIKSDVMDDRVKDTLNAIPTNQIQRSINSIHKTPFLSPEGKKERIAHLRELQQKRAEQKFEKDKRMAENIASQTYSLNGVEGTIDELSYLFPGQIKSPRKKKAKLLTLADIKGIDDRMEFNLQQIQSAMKKGDKAGVKRWQDEQKKAINVRRQEMAKAKASKQDGLFDTGQYNDDGIRFNRNPRR